MQEKRNYLKFKVALEDICNPKADSYPLLDEKRNMMLRGLGCCSFTLEIYDVMYVRRGPIVIRGGKKKVSTKGR